MTTAKAPRFPTRVIAYLETEGDLSSIKWTTQVIEASAPDDAPMKMIALYELKKVAQVDCSLAAQVQRAIA